MNCERTRALLGAHLDGELDAANDRELQEHVRGCEVCQSVASEQENLRRLVRQGTPYHRAPQGLESRVRGALRGQPTRDPASATSPKAAPIRSPRVWQWATAAATIAAVAAGMWIGSVLTERRAAEQFLAEELVSAHVRSLETGRLTDVQSSDQHTVKPWFAGKTDFSPPVHDLAAEGFPLIGGRLDYLAGHSAAALVFQGNKHIINVFIWPAGAGKGPQSGAMARRGYNIVSWQQAELQFCAVSDLNRPELESFAGSYREK